MIRILIIGSFAAGSLESAYERSFKRLRNCRIDCFNIDAYKARNGGFGLARRIASRLVSPLSRAEIQRDCARFLSRNRNAYDAILLFKGAEFSRASLERYRDHQQDAIWMNLNPDDPFNVGSRGSTNANIRSALSFFDIYLIWSRKLVTKLKDSGCKRVEYLPFGYDPDFHRPPAGNGRGGHYPMISFIGAWDREREAILEELADLDVLVFGRSWERARKNSPLGSKIVTRDLYGKDLASMVFGSKVCLNLLRSQNSGAHNMRTFEIPAMEGLMLATRSEEQHEYFPEGEASLMFEATDELRNQIKRACRDTDLAKAIRSRSRLLAQNHSYVQRASEILQLVRTG